MQLKKSVFMALALVAMGVASCDQISDDDRYLTVDDPISPSDSTGSDTTDINAPIYHSVLVEEFSGQLCVNCPAASEALEVMQEANGGPNKVIVVSIHAGRNMNLAIGVGQNPQFEGLATDFGEQLFSRYGLQSEPNAVIDRTGGVLSQPNWLTAIVNGLRRETTVALSARSSYNEADRSVTVSVMGRAKSDFTGNAHVWLTEDSIVTMQLFSSGPVIDHRFNNIFRTSATPIDGVPVTISAGEDMKEIYTTTIKLDDIWRPRHMAVVAFVDNSSGVVQAARTEVLPSE